MDDPRVWIGLGCVAALGGAGVAIFGKVGLAGVDPTAGTAIRSVIMAVVLVGVGLSTGTLQKALSGTSSLDRRALVFIVLAGLSGAVSWLAYFAALRVGGAAQVAALDRLSLPLVLVFGALFLGERYGWRGWIGMVLVLGGIYLIGSERPRSDPEADAVRTARPGLPPPPSTSPPRSVP